jgi:hypothetical protein
MPSLRDYFDDPKALQLFKGLSLADQSDVLRAVDPALEREHLTAVHRQNQALGAEAEAQIPGAVVKDVARATAAIPRAIGTVGSGVPLIGAVPAALGETAAQGIEMAGGEREQFSPAQIGVQATLGAIPGGMVARTLKPATKLGARAAGAVEGAALGTAATGVSALAEGRDISPSELGTGLAIGGALGGTLGSRTAAVRPDYTEKAHNMLYAAIKPDAGDVREFSEHMSKALPYIYANRGGHINGIADFEQAARGTMNRLWKLHIEPVVAMNSYAPVDTAHVADALRGKITRDTPPSVAKAIERAAAKFDEPRTLGELNRSIKELNAETRGLQEASGKTARTLRTDPKTAWKFDQLNQLRSTLADEAGKITGNGDVYMKLRKDWGALSEVADAAGESAKRWEHQQKLEKASLVPGLQRTTKAVMGGLGFGGQAAVRRGAAEVATEYMANPDRQVKGAFKRLRFGQRMAENFPEPVPAPERKLLPAMGETGEPSLGDLQNRLPEDWQAAKSARQRAEGRRALTGQTRSERIAQSRGPVQGETVPITVNPVPEPPSVYRGPERRRSPLDPEVIAESRRRAAQGGAELSERRRMSTGEAAMTPGATLSDESNLNFYGYPEAAKFFGNIERKKR